MSPGAEPTIAGAAIGSGLGFSTTAGTAGLGASVATGVGSTVSSSFWYSQKLIVCGCPFSVMVKSLAVRPSIGLPSLSFTETISTTSWVLEVNFGTPPAGVAAGGCCWPGISERQLKNAMAARNFRMLEPHPQIETDRAHLVRRRRQSVLSARDRRHVGRIGDGVQGVGGVEPKVGIHPLADLEASGQRTVERELAGAGDDVAAGIAPLARQRSVEGGRIEEQPGGRVVKRSARIERADAVGEALYRGGEGRGQRQAAPDRHLGGDGPLLEDGAAPAAH